MATRAAFKNRGVVWTEEMKEEQKRRYRRLFLEILWWSPLTLGLWPSMQLERGGIIPQWASGVLPVLLIVAVFVLRFVIRSSKLWKELN
jgi:hypothetical protein